METLEHKTSVESQPDTADNMDITESLNPDKQTTTDSVGASIPVNSKSASSSKTLSAESENIAQISKTETKMSQDEDDDDEIKKPEVKSERMTQLMKKIDKTIQKSLTGCKFSNFARAYKNIYKKKPKLMKRIADDFAENFLEIISSDIEANLRDDGLPEKLAELEKIAASIKSDKPAWRPSGDPNKDSLAHTMPILQEHKQKLEGLLREIKKENELLISSVKARQEQFEEDREELKVAVDSLNEKSRSLDASYT